MLNNQNSQYYRVKFFDIIYIKFGNSRSLNVVLFSENFTTHAYNLSFKGLFYIYLNTCIQKELESHSQFLSPFSRGSRIIMIEIEAL